MNASYNKAEILFQQGNMEKSKKICQEILKNNPKEINALILISVIAYKTNNINKSLEILNYSIKHFPKTPELFYNKAHVLYFKKNYNESLNSVDKAIELNKKYFECYNLKGLILQELGKESFAIEYFKKSVEINPGYFEAYKNLFNIYNNYDQHDDALKILDNALKFISKNFELHFLKSLVLSKQRKLNDAVRELNKTINYKNNDSEFFNLRGLLHANLNNFDLAVMDFEQAIKLDPKKINANHNMGNLMKKNHKFAKAAEYYKKALKIDRFYKHGLGNYFNAKLSICNWEDYEIEKKKLNNYIEENKDVCNTFHLLSITDSPSLQFKNSILENNGYLESSRKKNNFLLKKNKKIKIGYYSADFYNHPVAFQISELIENHNRNKFEIIGFSFNSKIDETKERLISAFDNFLNVENNSDQEIVNLSRKLGIDIAVDLMGYTYSNRFLIFEKRCAPIQINYLGFPCTTGSKNIDYIISDKNIIDKINETNYSEKIIYLPDTFMVTDSKRNISKNKTSRDQYGLPNDSIVLCCFSKFYKITPKIFEIWTNILKKFEKSVLWLSFDNLEGSTNLINLIEKKNINKKKIIFADKIKNNQDHLDRIKLADLCLDTFPYGSHSSCCDYIIAGLPIITIKGNSFASSVCSSILKSIELNELIAKDFDDYEKKIAELISNKEKLLNIKNKIKINKSKKSLFNINRYTSKIERAFEICFDNKLKNLNEKNIIID